MPTLNGPPSDCDLEGRKELHSGMERVAVWRYNSRLLRGRLGLQRGGRA